MSIDARLAELGITLPDAPAPAANYVPFVLVGNLLHISGQISANADVLPARLDRDRFDFYGAALLGIKDVGKGRHFRYAGIGITFVADAVRDGGVDRFEIATPQPVVACTAVQLVGTGCAVQFVGAGEHFERAFM